MVLSTLHTNDAPTTLTRMRNMGIAPFNIASSVILITAQRLARRLCPHCKTPYQAESHETRLLGGNPDAPRPVIFRPCGCERCDFQGYRGRLAIMEILRMNSELDELVARRAHTAELRAVARRKGFSSLAEDGARRVLDGSTSLRELARVVDLSPLAQASGARA